MKMEIRTQLLGKIRIREIAVSAHDLEDIVNLGWYGTELHSNIHISRDTSGTGRQMQLIRKIII